MKQSNDSTLEFYKYYDIPEEKTREIKPSKKIISAYDLYKMLEHEITGLDIELNQLLDSMHTYCKYNSSLLRKVFHKNQEEAIIPKCNGINFENKDHKMIINLYKFPNPGNRAVPEIKIIYYPKNDILKILGTPQKFLSYYYNYGYDFFKIKNKEDIECIEAHLNEIRNICLSSFWGKPQVWRDNQIERLLNSINISDDIFSVEFKYDKETNTLTPKIKNKRVNIPENNNNRINFKANTNPHSRFIPRSSGFNSHAKI